MSQDKGHATQVQAVIGALAGGAPAPVASLDLIASSLVTLAAARSLQAGSPIDIDVARFIDESVHG